MPLPLLGGLFKGGASLLGGLGGFGKGMAGGTLGNAANMAGIHLLGAQGAKHTAQFIGATMAENSINNKMQLDVMKLNNQRSRDNIAQTQAMDVNADSMTLNKNAQQKSSQAASP